MVAEDKRATAASPDVPDLDVPARPAVSGAARTASPVSGPARVQPASSFDDDDGLGMEIERDITRPFDAPSPARPGGHGGVSLDGPSKPRASSSGLDVTYRRLDPKREHVDGGPSLASRIGGPIAALVVFGGTAAALLRFVHRPSGTSPTSLLPSAFDGTSVPASGAVALTSLVLAIAIGYVGVRARTRSWMLVGAAAVVMLLALAMVTVTLASSGEHGPPPDGALLVPWLAPLAMLLGGIDVLVRSARRFVQAEGAAKLGGVPLAVLAGLLVFAAAEASRLASALPSFR